MSKWIYVLWPSFLTAAVGEMVFFALINPQELYLLGQPVYWSKMAIYSVGFLMFWALTALTAWLTLFLHEPSETAQAPTPSYRRHLIHHH